MMNISMNMALTMARPRPPQSPSRSSSLLTTITPFNDPESYKMERQNSNVSRFSLYSGVSERPMGWKRSSRNPELRSRSMNIRRWDGITGTSTEWDGLRKDLELWCPEGNCNVHLYGRGQSRRGPAFRVPVEALLETNCRPLMHRFLAEKSQGSPALSDCSNENENFFASSKTELYIPPPSTVERGEAFLYHTATRNFFAWVFGKPLVGTHLGGALVGLLNSMNEFRSAGEDNVQAVMDYMDEEGYAEMRNQPNHALAILFFAEHFHFKDLWIDAFAHCVGMNDKLISSTGFEFISRTTRALITRSRLEMDMRLDDCGRSLRTFLEDDLSDPHLCLTSGARAHLDKFRSFLQGHFVAKLGYWPPNSRDAKTAAFPKNIFRQMRSEFQSLYDFLADFSVTSSDPMPTTQLSGICALQSVKSFDQRHKFKPLDYPMPLLPEVEETNSKPAINKRLSWGLKSDKLKPDSRLVALSSLTKASNRGNSALFDCSLVRAYCGFEKEYVLSPSKAAQKDKLSQIDARKVRFILVYTILQILNSATEVPEQVRDFKNVPYNLCVLTAGCPPWKEEPPLEDLLQTQIDQAKDDFVDSQSRLEEASSASSPMDSIRPDIDYAAIAQMPELPRVKNKKAISVITSKTGVIRNALSTLGSSVPALHHPQPKRASHHEILVDGYENGTATPAARKSSSESESEDSSRWSESSDELQEPVSPTTSYSSVSSRRYSLPINTFTKSPIRDLLNRPMSTLGLRRMPSSVYSASLYDGESTLQPEPLRCGRGRKGPADLHMAGATTVSVQWDGVNGEANDELKSYLNA